MAEYSRTNKYRELREKLQNDTGSDDVNTKDLSRFESRLNRIDSTNFKAPEEKHTTVSTGGTHARTVEKPKEMLRRTQAKSLSPSFDTGYVTNENDTATFDDDYLNRYIKEVKDYNIAQGTADSENTSVNILRQLRRNQEKDEQKEAPSRPYPKRSIFRETDDTDDDFPDTTDIGFGKTRTLSSEERPAPSKKESSQNFTRHRPQDTRTENLSRTLFGEDDVPASDAKPASASASEHDTNSSATGNDQNLTKEDIMAEVQNMVNGNSQNTSDSSSPFVTNNSSASDNRDQYNSQAVDDRTARQQLLNETTQMRAQLDDYEDNLSEVSDKMRHTNRILNIVLVVLILALAIILGIVIYWIVLSRG